MPPDALTVPIATLTDEQRSLLAARLSRIPSSGDTPQIPRRQSAADVALACAQESFWLLHHLEAADSAYNCRAAHRLRGPLDVGALLRSLDWVLERHEALRASFSWKNGAVTQHITRRKPVQITQIDFSRVDAASLDDQLAEAVADEARRAFDLTSGPLLRATLFRIAADDHVLLIVMPHIVADRWSRGVLHRELAAAYSSERSGQKAALPELPIQYADFAAWQQQRIRSGALDHEGAYWKAALKGAPAALELPTDWPRPPEQSFAGAMHRFLLDAPLVDRVRAFSRAHNATLFMTLFAAFAAVLSRWADRDDLVIGTSTAGRPSPETERLIGCFINTLPLRVDLSGAPSFADLVRRVRRIALDAYAHAELPFKRIVSEAGAERSAAHGALVQVMLTLQNSPQRPLSLDGLAVEPLAIHSGGSKLDLTLEATDTKAGLACALEYRTDLFRLETIERFAGHWQTLLAAAIDTPLMSVTELPLMTAAEQDRLAAWNHTETPFEDTACVHELFASQAARTPDAVAVCCGAQSLTYAELDRRSTRLAHHLRRHGIGPDVPVGLLVERSTDMLVGLLGVLKAGGAYVPLDPAYPPERLALMLADSGAQLLVTQAHLTSVVTHDHVVCLDRDWPAIERESIAPVASGVTSAHLAYVIYTSGSTGTPKGVMLEHRNVANFFTAMDEILGREPGVWLAVTSISFDIAVLELFWTLARGFRVVLRPDLRTRSRADEHDAARDVSVASLVRRHRATHLQCTPSMLRVVLLEPDGREALAGLQHLLVGGEPLPPSLAADLGESPGRRMINMYGPTETTVWSTSWAVDGTADVMSIGRPIANTEIHVLDARRQSVPVGIPGEVYIGGAGVARGYLGRPDLTAERFVTDPFSNSPAARMYRTGDLARYQPDGTIEFLGRADHQVKFRGFRIELGEIEAALSRHQGVREAIVTVREDRTGDPYLAAYVVAAPGESPSPALLRQHLRHVLPDYMVPSQFVEMDALPLTPNRKVDRAALPTPAAAAAAASSDRRSASATERALAGIWAEVLNVSTVGPDDDFFDLGGHSLLAVQLISRIESVFGCRLALATIFEERTVRDLANVVDGKQTPPEQNFVAAAAVETTPQSEVRPDAPLGCAQESFWLMHQLEAASPAYNCRSAHRLRGTLDLDALQRSLDLVVDRHQALRASFGWTRDSLRQTITQTRPVHIGHVDLSHVDADRLESELAAAMTTEARGTFDLTSGVLLRATLFRIAADDHVLLVVMPHIAADHWSRSVLHRELELAYSAIRQGTTPALPALPIQYADFSTWQQHRILGDALAHERAYWKAALKGAPQALALPTDYPRPPAQTYAGATHRFLLPAPFVDRLRALSRAQNATLFMTLFSGFAAVLSRWTDRDDLVIGTSTAGRVLLDTEQLIGCFINTLPLRVDLCGAPSFADLVGRVRRIALGAFDHAELPFKHIVQEVGVERSAAHGPIVQVMFTLHNTPQRPLSLAGLTSERIPVDVAAAKFDLTLEANETPAGMVCTIEFRTDLFRIATIERFAGHWQALLAAAVDNPLTPVPALCPTFVEVVAPTRTPSGEVVRAALSAPFAPTIASLPGGQTVSATVSTLIDMWAEVLNVPTVGPDDDFFDLGGHSLRAVQLMSRVEKTFGRRLPLAALFEARTVRELADVLDDRKKRSEWISLVPVQTLGSKPPFFCVHGVGGEVLAYAALAARLAPDQPFIAFRAPGYSGSSEPLHSVEEQAALYVREMIAFQPNGPYYIGGYSHGGRVALEMALQLEAMGRTVAFLGIIDTTPRWFRDSRFRRLIGWLRNFPLWLWYDGCQSSIQANVDRFRRMGYRLLASWSGRFGGGDKSAGPALDDVMNLDQLPASIQELYRRDFQAFLRYQPGRECGDVTLFRSLGQPLTGVHEPDLWWGRVSHGTVEVRPIAGNHMSILSEPHVRGLAAELRDALECAQARAGRVSPDRVDAGNGVERVA